MKKKAKWKNRIEFGVYLRGQRLALGLNMREMAERVGLSAQQLQNYEHGGVVRPGYYGISRLAAAYQLPEKQLVDVFFGAKNTKGQ